MSLKRIFLSLTVIIASLSGLWAQPPCLQGYSYRAAVTINNPALTTQSGTVEIKFRASDLIDAGQMLSTCADIRFMTANNVLLRHWTDENSEKTKSQSVWVELKNMVPGANTIYMFYGNPAATSQSNDSVFIFFDDFLGNSLSGDWNLCEGNYTVNNGILTLFENTSIYTANSFQKSIMTQAHVTGITNSGSSTRASFGQLPRNFANTQYNPGYLMSFNIPANSFEVFNSSESCFYPSVSRGNTTGTKGQGIWSFSWKTAKQLLLSPPGIPQITYGVDSLGAYTNFGATLSLQGNGTMAVDWVSIWNVNEYLVPGNVGTGEYISTPVSIEISGNTNVCSDPVSNIILSATNISGAYYTWFYNSNIVQEGSGPLANQYIRTAAIPEFSGNYSVSINLASSNCGTQNDDVNVTVYPAYNAGTITESDTVCAYTNSGSIALTNYGGTVDYWEYRILPGSVWNPQSVKSDVYAYSGLSQSHSFRAHINNGVCGDGFSEESMVIVSPTSTGGILSEDATVCQGSSGNLSLTGYTGNITRWESMPAGQTWQVINQTNNELIYSNIQDSTFYRALVTSGVCPPAYSDTILRAVSPPTENGTVVGGKYICAADSKMDTLYLQGHIGNVLQWQFSPSITGPWSSNTTSSEYFLYQGLNNTTYYRAQVQSPGCNAEYSDIDTVIVEQQPVSGTLSGSATVCAVSNSGLMQLTGYSGKITNWFISSDSASWLALNHYYDTLHYTNLQQKRHYRATVNSLHDVCVTNSSNFATINVSPQTVEGTLYSEKTRFCADSNLEVIRINNKTGSVLRWESSPTGTTPWTTIYNTSDSLAYQNLSATTFYRAVVKSGACVQLNTPSLQIRIDQPSQGGILLGSTEVCEQVNNGTLNLMGYSGTINQWQASTDGIAWGNIPATPIASYPFSGLTDTTQYRVIVKNGECAEDTSTIAKIMVNPLPDVAFTANNVNLGNPVNFQNTTTIAGGSVQTWHWDFGNEVSLSSQNPNYTYPEPGIYHVRLTATSNKLCVDSISHIVSVFELPDVDFSYTKVCFLSEMPFIITSAMVSGTAYIWNFGDGKEPVTATNASTTHFYATAGTYTVTLKAISSSGGVDSITKNVIVYPRSEPDFTFSNICAGNIASFSNHTMPTNLSITYLWDFGNGSTDTRSDPEVLYTTDETYLVKLIATTSNGCADSISKPITVFPQPTAAFSVEDVPYQQPSVFFNESEIEYGNLNYLWDFGDGKTSNILNPIYTYKSDGVFDVELTALSDEGCIHSVSKVVTIFSLPESEFLVENVCLGDSSQFINKSTLTPLSALNFEWSFGDGQTSTEKSPIHYYTNPGNYPVRLICISDKSGRDTVFGEANVFDLPAVDFSFNEACDGFSTSFENTSEVSDGEISTVLWDFGEGTNSVQLNPVKEYLNPDIYQVKLEITSSTGCKNSITKDVIVHQNPVADFEAQSVCVGMFSEFINNTFIDNTNRPYTLTYLWDFADGSQSTAFEPDYRFENAGVYRVLLSVSSDAECIDTIARYIEVYNLPDAGAGNDTTVEKGFPINLNASGGEFYEWSPEAGLSNISIPNPEARPMETTTYLLRVTDGHSCVNYDSLIITVDDVMRIIPSNVLTPNNNNENDTWNIVNIDSYPEAELQLFDRWGKLIFETTNYQNDWTGTNKNGDILPDGTYYYVIIVSREFNIIYKGAITILRDK